MSYPLRRLVSLVLPRPADRAVINRITEHDKVWRTAVVRGYGDALVPHVDRYPTPASRPSSTACSRPPAVAVTEAAGAVGGYALCPSAVGTVPAMRPIFPRRPSVPRLGGDHGVGDQAAGRVSLVGCGETEVPAAARRPREGGCQAVAPRFGS